MLDGWLNADGEVELTLFAETNKRHVVDASSGVFIAGGTFRTIIQTFFLI
jgi:hypothetical protein